MQHYSIKKWLLLIVSVCFLFACASTTPKPDPEEEALQQKMEAVRKSRAEEERRIELAKQRAMEIEQVRQDSETQKQAAEEQQFIYEDIYFKINSSKLTPNAIALLKRKSAYLRDNPGITVMLESYCDDRGGPLFNLRLGDLRGGRVKTFLIREGISVDRMMVVSYGKERRLDSGSSPEARAKNRRVHFMINK